jgi:hypothetical protein
MGGFAGLAEILIARGANTNQKDEVWMDIDHALSRRYPVFH